MALRDKISTNAAPYLQPGEQVLQAFAGQTKSGWFQMFGLVGLLIARPKIRPVVVTDRRIVALQGSIWSLATAKGVAFEAPRQQLGEPSGLWWKCTALPETLYVHKRFHKDVVAANQSMS
jgi:hypothetical protein